jgi:hypothetical protein
MTGAFPLKSRNVAHESCPTPARSTVFEEDDDRRPPGGPETIVLLPASALP